MDYNFTSVEKFGTLTGIPYERVKYIAFQSSTGPVSDYIQRYIEQHADQTLVQIKGELNTRFVEVVDYQHELLFLGSGRIFLK